MTNKTLDFVCDGMENGGRFPVEHTGRGRDASPGFSIRNLSPEAKTLAVTLEDLSHPVKNFTHWVIWNIPAGGQIRGGIPAGKRVPELGGACQGIGYGFHRYAGLKPPKGKTHTYRFTVYALDCEMRLSPRSLKSAFLRGAKGHILQTGSITADFE